MNRKDFMKKGILGSFIFTQTDMSSAMIENDIDELHSIKPLGYNHIPNPSSQIMDNLVIHRADTRGHANHGWLNSYHSFSFANYYNPDRMHFGALRVLNDDTIDGGTGFGTHPHDNLEIISIPLDGDLEHKDSMGNVAVIKQGDVQVMSAGSGITHSEYNANKDRHGKFLQIWVFPNKKNVTPRYDQITLKPESGKNQLEQILSPSPNDAGVWIHQNAWFHLGKFDQHIKTNYELKDKKNGVYAFVIEGEFEVAGQPLSRRDGLGIWSVDSLDIATKSPDARILLMEVPMSI